MARLIVYVEDVMDIMGMGKTASFALMARIRKDNQMEKRSKINAVAFSNHTKIPLEILLEMLNKHKK